MVWILSYTNENKLYLRIQKKEQDMRKKNRWQQFKKIKAEITRLQSRRKILEMMNTIPNMVFWKTTCSSNQEKKRKMGVNNIEIRMEKQCQMQRQFHYARKKYMLRKIQKWIILKLQEKKNLVPFNLL